MAIVSPFSFDISFTLNIYVIINNISAKIGLFAYTRKKTHENNFTSYLLTFFTRNNLYDN
jgi:hypothetical protein